MSHCVSYAVKSFFGFDVIPRVLLLLLLLLFYLKELEFNSESVCLPFEVFLSNSFKVFGPTLKSLMPLMLIYDRIKGMAVVSFFHIWLHFPSTTWLLVSL